MFTSNSTIDPIVSETNPARTDIVFFALSHMSGWTLQSTTLHIAIDPGKMEYNDAITLHGWREEQEVIDSVDLYDGYLLNLVHLSKNRDFLAITENMIHHDYGYDGFTQTIEYYIDGLHRRFDCWGVSIIDGDPIQLNSKGEGSSDLFFTWIKGTRELTEPSVTRYYQDKRDKDKK